MIIASYLLLGFGFILIVCYLFLGFVCCFIFSPVGVGCLGAPSSRLGLNEECETLSPPGTGLGGDVWVPLPVGWG